MPVKLILFLVSVNTVASQLLMKKGVTQLGGIKSISGLPAFFPLAVKSPWLLTSVTLQIIGYVAWYFVVTREKLGIAVAISGASFYILMAMAAWYFYGETLTILQCAGIALIIAGVVCVSLPIN
jgi:drug/metabolite transporter (DMT)-like permease